MCSPATGLPLMQPSEMIFLLVSIFILSYSCGAECRAGSMATIHSRRVWFWSSLEFSVVHGGGYVPPCCGWGLFAGRAIDGLGILEYRFFLICEDPSSFRSSRFGYALLIMNGSCFVAGVLICWFCFVCGLFVLFGLRFFLSSKFGDLMVLRISRDLWWLWCLRRFSCLRWFYL